MVHVTTTSKVCKFNLLMRGPVTSNEQDIELQERMCRQRKANKVSGIGKNAHTLSAIRILGPFLKVMDLNGEHIEESKGHPLGCGKKHHRPPQCESPFENLTGLACHASLYATCNSSCILCKGVITID